MTAESATPSSPDSNLAIVVPKPRVDTILSALRDEGVYDDTRRIVSRDEERVAIPVHSQPEFVDVETVEFEGCELRERGLDSRLRRLGWSETLIEEAPSSWAVIGDVIVADFDPLPSERRSNVGRILTELHGGATVLHRTGITGDHRVPNTETVHGHRTLTEHVEADTRYVVDLDAVMFSPGNQAERRRMGDLVSERETVLDLFAGIGYFTLPMARAGAAVYAVERNTTAYEFLLDNLNRNDVRDRVTPICGDCRSIVENGYWPLERPSGGSTAGGVDRVVMGHFDAPGYLDVALSTLKPGGVVHVHALTSVDDGRGDLDERIEAQLATTTRTPVERESRQIKTYAPGVEHVVVDIRC